MSREVRRVVADWQHPRALDGKHYRPLLDGGNYFRDLHTYAQNSQMWRRGMVRDIVNDDWISREDAGVCESRFETFYGPAPTEAEYMPCWTQEDATHYMLYETITKGTPLTPAFAKQEDLAQWCVKNNITLCPTRKLTFTGWMKLANGVTVGQLLREKIDTIRLELAYV